MSDLKTVVLEEIRRAGPDEVFAALDRHWDGLKAIGTDAMSEIRDAVYAKTSPNGKAD